MPDKVFRSTPRALLSASDVPVNLPHASRVQAEAAVLGLALAGQAGLDLPAAAARLAAVSVPGGRYRVLPGRFTIIDDTYNASPLSVGAALEALSAFGGRKISVLGRMLELGEDEEAELHAEVGHSPASTPTSPTAWASSPALLGERALPHGAGAA